MPHLNPVLFKKFSERMSLLGPFEDNPLLGVAISGGSDSLALALLLHRWALLHKGNIHAFHVNHNLRPESSQEAELVKSWLSTQNIPCSILTWEHTDAPLLSHIQEKARRERYKLLEQACYTQGILHIATAHHRDDQKETHIMRQQAKSTEYGLSGMSAVNYFTHCRLIRPVLSFSKNELNSILGDHPYLEDPSNKNPLFKRTHLRTLNLEDVDVSPYQEERKKIEKDVAYFLALYSQVEPQGYGTLSLQAIQDGDPFIFKRSLSCLIRCIGNLDYFPRSSSVERLIKRLQHKDFATMSLGRCVVFVQKEKIWVVPDRRSLPIIHSFQENTKVWGRFHSKGNLPPQVYMKPLGPDGWKQVCSSLSTHLPYHVVITFPAYWDNQKVKCVPFLSSPEEMKNYPSLLYEPKNSLLAEFFV